MNITNKLQNNERIVSIYSVGGDCGLTNGANDDIDLSLITVPTSP